MASSSSAKVNQHSTAMTVSHSRRQSVATIIWPVKLRPLLDSVVTRLLLLALGLIIIGTILRYYALTDFLKEDVGDVVENQQLALATYVARDIDEKILQRKVL